MQAYLSKPAFAPAGDPPYIELVGQLTARCIADDKGAVLSVHIEPGPYAEMLGAALQRYTMVPGWGVHALAISLVQGNMLDLIGTQSAAWAARK